MINKYLFLGKNNKHYLVDFLILNKKIDAIYKKQDTKYDKNMVIFFLQDVEKKYAEKELNEINLLKFKNFIILPNHLRNIEVNKEHEVLYYPTNIEKFNIFTKNSNNSFYFGDIMLEGNYLINTNNNLQVYFTETQASIFKFLIVEKTVKKTKLRGDVLNFNASLDTKSLESHLSRLRKKLKEIKSEINIISLDYNYVKLVENGASH